MQILNNYKSLKVNIELGKKKLDKSAFYLTIFNTTCTTRVILTHSIKLFAYIAKVDSNREVKLSDFS